MGENPEYLLGDRENPGPLMILTYPEVLHVRLVSTKFRDIIDEDYFWKLKTHRDFGVEIEDPISLGKTWKEEYRNRFKGASQELLTTSKGGDVDRVRELLDFGVNPNHQDEDGEPALLWASEFGHIKIVEMLLTAGVDVNLQNKYRDTALIGASWGGYREIVEMLLTARADVDLKNKFGDTALIVASRQGHTEIVDILRSRM